MARESLYQLSMCAVDPDRLGLGRDSFERRLREDLTHLVSDADFVGWGSSHLGRPPCSRVRLTGMLLLQFRYDLSDAELISRCQRDLGFRYALRLDDPVTQPPKVSSLRRFRARLRTELGEEFLFRRVVALARDRELISDADVQVVDSTDTRCRGACIDTYNLVSVGIGTVVRRMARFLDVPALGLAREWGLDRYMGRSIKGRVDIDWSDVDARNALLTEEIRDADALAQRIGELGADVPDDVKASVDLLRTVSRQDVEELEDGTFAMKRGTAKGRTISITDPEARHGRKSPTKPIQGFKTHVLGTPVSEFVLGIAMTDAATKDAEPTVALLEQAAKAGLLPKWAIGDRAYGTGPNLRRCAARGVAVVSKLARKRGPTMEKGQFTIDLQAGTVTCPAGQVTREFTMVKHTDSPAEKVRCYKFPKATCQVCPLKSQCGSQVKRGGRRTVTLSPYEPELQRLKAFNAQSEAKPVLRVRAAAERLISHLIRLGMRHARYFGLELTRYQASMTATAHNLQRIFTLTKWSPA